MAMPIDKPILLVTNDDGIQGIGLISLVDVLRESGLYDVYVCAPDRENSAVGHSVTAHGNVVVHQVEMNGITAFKASGTPADCACLALSGVLFQWENPTLVLSGINRGSNCGYHIVYSGTVAGAREAFIYGVPSMAISYDWTRGRSQDIDFRIAAQACLPLINAVVSNILKGDYPNGFFLNVDVPVDVSKHKGYKITKQGSSMIRTKWKALASSKSLPLPAFDNNREATSLSLNSESNSPATEIISVPNSDKNQEGYHSLFRRQISEHEYGEEGSEFDFGALQEGYITITPLGIKSQASTESCNLFKQWACSVPELCLTSCL